MKCILTILILAFFVSCNETPTKQKAVNDPKEVTVSAEESTRIEIFSERFQWTVRYAGEDNILGESDFKLISEKNPLGLVTSTSIKLRQLELLGEVMKNQSEFDKSDDLSESYSLEDPQKSEELIILLDKMSAKHDKNLDQTALNDLLIMDTMVLCVDQEYEFQLRSKDVIHSAYFPHFRMQMNSVPGMTTRLKFTPKETTKARRLAEKNNNFEFMLLCNKICGSGHNSMKMVVRVVDATEYSSWLKENQDSRFSI